MEGDYINVSPSLKIPPLTEIRELVHASQEVERSEENDVLPEKKWIAQLIQPGTSLGGARPKAGVLDEKVIYASRSFLLEKMTMTQDFGSTFLTC